MPSELSTVAVTEDQRSPGRLAGAGVCRLEAAHLQTSVAGGEGGGQTGDAGAHHDEVELRVTVTGRTLPPQGTLGPRPRWLGTL